MIMLNNVVIKGNPIKGFHYFLNNVEISSTDEISGIKNRLESERNAVRLEVEKARGVSYE